MLIINYLNHSWSVLKGDLSHIRLVKRHFSIAYKNAFHMRRANPNFDGKYKFVNSNNTIPNGLLSKLIAFLEHKNIEWNLNDVNNIRKRKMLPKNAFDFSLYDDNKVLKMEGKFKYQSESVIRALYYTRGIINLATNAGKTEVMAGIIKNLLLLDKDFIIFIIVPSLQLLEQTSKRLEKRLQRKVYVYHDRRRSIGNINITTVQTLHAERNTERKNFIKHNVNCFFIDEVHAVSSSKNWYSTLQYAFLNAKYRFGMTGTVKLDDRVKEYMLESVTGAVIHRVTNEELIRLGVSVKPTIHFLPIYISGLLDGMTFQQELKHVFRSREFYMPFLKFFNSKDDGGNMILVSYLNHGRILETYLPQAKFLSGKDKVVERNKVLKEWADGKYKTIIATQIFKFGLDTHSIKRMYLLSIGAKTSKTLQELGRALRKNEIGRVDIYFIKFLGSSYLIKHAIKQKYICEQEGFEIISHKQLLY